MLRESINGFFGKFGGRYVEENLMKPLEELEKTFNKYITNPDFFNELKDIRNDFIGRPTPLLYAERTSKELGGADIYIKMEGLAHTGAHKINNAVGQALLAKRMGKTKIIAETGAGQHGLATAAACAKLGLHCTIYMGEVDIRRQQPNVAAMELFGAEVVCVKSGMRTLKEAIDAALYDWSNNPEETYYLLGSAVGPSPFPDIVRTFQSIIGQETEMQCKERGIKISAMCACVGGGSNAAGFFEPFIDRNEPALYAAEAGGIGPGIGNNAARMEEGAVEFTAQGFKSRFLIDEKGNISSTRSISAGLDYAGIGPQLAALGETGRVKFSAVTDKEALEAVKVFAKNEGVIFALESAHAGALALKLAPSMNKKDTIIVNMSGRGDKDIFITSPIFRKNEWKEFLKLELARLEQDKTL